MKRQLRFAHHWLTVPALLLGVSLLAPIRASAQEAIDVSSLPMVVGPGTQGFVVYKGPAIPNLFWTCGSDNAGNLFSIGEVAEEVHMLQAGDLASFTIAYHVDGGIVATSGTATAIVNIYANDANDSVAPPAGLMASYTIPGLPGSTRTNHTFTHDVSVPISVGKDLWIGVEIVSPPGTAGSMLGATPDLVPPQSFAPTVGSSHNLTWFGPAACTLPPGELLDNANNPFFRLFLNYTLAVRIFPPVECDFPIANGDFETGLLAPWSGEGRYGVLLTEVAGSASASGAYQGVADTGFNYSISGLSPALTPLLELSLNLPSGTLSTLPGGGVIHGSALFQTLTVGAGDVLTFKWNMLTSEPTPSTQNDVAFLTISSGVVQELADTSHPSFGPSLTPSPRRRATRATATPSPPPAPSGWASGSPTASRAARIPRS